jgi:hypothetical protein
MLSFSRSSEEGTVEGFSMVSISERHRAPDQEELRAGHASGSPGFLGIETPAVEMNAGG